MELLTPLERAADEGATEDGTTGGMLDCAGGAGVTTVPVLTGALLRGVGTEGSAEVTREAGGGGA